MPDFAWPWLQQKKGVERGESKNLAQPIRELLDTHLKPVSKAPTEATVIHVSSIASTAAFAYERLRYTLDYRDEHLLRRSAIERLLRQRLFLLGKNHTEKIARSILVELIRARYFENDSVPESRVADVARVID